MIRQLLVFLMISLCALSAAGGAGAAEAAGGVSVPILLYHRFGPTVADGMTIRTAAFQSHLEYLSKNGYTVIPLRRLVDWYRGRGAAPPAKSVVIVEDDAHRSVYTDMFPLIRKYRVPVTIFIYPSAVSNASYAMTWDQLREMKKSGLVEFQSHTFWHPNFKKERKKLPPAEFDRLVSSQLSRSREKIERELGVTVDMLAWPFGIYDDDLIRRASAAGYVATFTIERRHATPRESVMKLPRYLMVAADDVNVLARLLAGNAPKRAAVY